MGTGHQISHDMFKGMQLMPFMSVAIDHIEQWDAQACVKAFKDSYPCLRGTGPNVLDQTEPTKTWLHTVMTAETSKTYSHELHFLASLLCLVIVPWDT